MNIKLLLLLFFSINGQASSFITCDLSVKILAIKGNIIKFKVIKVTEGKSGFGDCNFSKGNELEAKIKNPETLTPGKNVTIKYNNYSGMGPTGPVGGTTWTVK